MNVLVMVVLGAAFGVCVSFAFRIVRPRPPALEVVAARLGRPGRSVAAELALAEQARSARWRARLSAVGVRIVEATGFADLATLNRELRVAGRTLEQHGYAKVAGAVGAAATPLLLSLVVTALGVPVPAPVWIIAVPLGAAAGFFWPDLRLRERAQVRRREFRHAFGSYLDLVSVLVSGGAGMTTALVTAANSGEGWAYEELRTALRRAQLTNRSPWDTLAELGAELDMPEVTELAAAVRLAGDEGARVAGSVTAKAESLRGKLRSEIETAAEAQTERMILPGVLLVVGLVMLVIYAVTTQASSPAITGPTVVVDAE